MENKFAGKFTKSQKANKTHGLPLRPNFSLLKYCFVFFIATLGFLNLSKAHGPGDGRIDIVADHEEDFIAGSVHYSFELADLKEHHPIASDDLLVVHERKLHLFIFDESLTDFQHLHPEFKAGKWSVDFSIKRNGTYRIWIQGKLTSDRAEFSSAEQIRVVQGEPARTLPPDLGDKRQGHDQNSVATLSNGVIYAKKHTMMTLQFSHLDGSPAKLIPYLGALAHIVGVSSNGEQLLHIHPSGGSNPNEMTLHLEFPSPGSYRLWIQFNDNGSLRLVPMSVVVK